MPLQQARDPGFFMPLVLHVFAESLFRLVVVIMCNLLVPESVHFAQELRVFSLVQRWGVLPIKDWRKESERRLALTACGRSGVSVQAASSQPCRASSPLATWTIGSGTGAEAGDDEDSVHSSSSSAVCGGVCKRMASVCSNLSVEISCADVAVAWSLPPACEEKKIVSAVDNCK